MDGEGKAEKNTETSFYRKDVISEGCFHRIVKTDEFLRQTQKKRRN